MAGSMNHGSSHQGQSGREMARRNYRMLGVSALAMLVLMYLIMFTMIYSLGEFIQNINFAYMAIMMATPMVVMMPLMMSRCTPTKSSTC